MGFHLVVCHGERQIDLVLVDAQLFGHAHPRRPRARRRVRCRRLANQHWHDELLIEERRATRQQRLSRLVGHVGDRVDGERRLDLHLPDAVLVVPHRVGEAVVECGVSSERERVQLGVAAVDETAPRLDVGGDARGRAFHKVEAQAGALLEVGPLGLRLGEVAGGDAHERLFPPEERPAMVTREEASLEQVEGVALALRQHANLGEAQRRPRSLGHSLELSRRWRRLMLHERVPRRRRSGGTLALALDRVGGELLRDQQVDEVLRHGLRAGGIALALQILGEALVIGGAHRLGQEHPLELGEELCALAIRADVTLLAGDAERLKVGIGHSLEHERGVQRVAAHRLQLVEVCAYTPIT